MIYFIGEYSLCHRVCNSFIITQLLSVFLLASSMAEARPIEGVRAEEDKDSFCQPDLSADPIQCDLAEYTKAFEYLDKIGCTGINALRAVFTGSLESAAPVLAVSGLRILASKYPQPTLDKTLAMVESALTVSYVYTVLVAGIGAATVNGALAFLILKTLEYNCSAMVNRAVTELLGYFGNAYSPYIEPPLRAACNIITSILRPTVFLPKGGSVGDIGADFDGINMMQSFTTPVYSPSGSQKENVVTFNEKLVAPFSHVRTANCSVADKPVEGLYFKESEGGFVAEFPMRRYQHDLLGNLTHVRITAANVVAFEKEALRGLYINRYKYEIKTESFFSNYNNATLEINQKSFVSMEDTPLLSPFFHFFYSGEANSTEAFASQDVFVAFFLANSRETHNSFLKIKVKDSSHLNIAFRKRRINGSHDYPLLSVIKKLSGLVRKEDAFSRKGNLKKVVKQEFNTLDELKKQRIVIKSKFFHNVTDAVEAMTETLKPNALAYFFAVDNVKQDKGGAGLKKDFPLPDGQLTNVSFVVGIKGKKTKIYMVRRNRERLSEALAKLEESAEPAKPEDRIFFNMRQFEAGGEQSGDNPVYHACSGAAKNTTALPFLNKQHLVINESDVTSGSPFVSCSNGLASIAVTRSERPRQLYVLGQYGCAGMSTYLFQSGRWQLRAVNGTCATINPSNPSDRRGGEQTFTVNTTEQPLTIVVKEVEESALCEPVLGDSQSSVAERVKFKRTYQDMRVQLAKNIYTPITGRYEANLQMYMTNFDDESALPIISTTCWQSAPPEHYRRGEVLRSKDDIDNAILNTAREACRYLFENSFERENITVMDDVQFIPFSKVLRATPEIGIWSPYGVKEKAFLNYVVKLQVAERVDAVIKGENRKPTLIGLVAQVHRSKGGENRGVGWIFLKSDSDGVPWKDCAHVLRPDVVAHELAHATGVKHSGGQFVKGGHVAEYGAKDLMGGDFAAGPWNPVSYMPFGFYVLQGWVTNDDMYHRTIGEIADDREGVNFTIHSFTQQKDKLGVTRIEDFTEGSEGRKLGIQISTGPDRNFFISYPTQRKGIDVPFQEKLRVESVEPRLYGNTYNRLTVHDCSDNHEQHTTSASRRSYNYNRELAKGKSCIVDENGVHELEVSFKGTGELVLENGGRSDYAVVNIKARNVSGMGHRGKRKVGTSAAQGRRRRQ